MEASKKLTDGNNKTSYGWILFLLFIVVLFSTNPSENKFKEYLKTEFVKDFQPQGSVERAIAEFIASPTAYLIGLTTKRKNYLIFSTYEISIFGVKYKYVGIFNHFFEFYNN